MKRVSTSELIPGMVTSEDVYNFNDQLILPKGLILTDKTITKLEFYSIVNVRVEDKMVKLSEDGTPIEDSYFVRLARTPEFQEFQQNFEETSELFKTSINNVISENTTLDTDVLLQQTFSLASHDGKHVNMFDMLHNMRQYDDATYIHCVNVALICNILAGWLHMSKEDIELATLCGLLHDIGKIKIPDQIMKKPGKLTAMETKIIRTHPYEGYRILEKLPINDHIKKTAIMHHERCDGSGYPIGLNASKIDSFAKLVSICDVYDAMTSARVYRGAMCPFKVIAIFEEEGLQKYDPHYILTFLENVVNTYIQHRVRLTNGKEGDVVYINPGHLSKPTIKIGSHYIDLSKEPHVSIDAIV